MTYQSHKKFKTMNYGVITVDAFIEELELFFKTHIEYHKVRASAIQSLLEKFGYTDEQIQGFVEQARKNANKK